MIRQIQHIFIFLFLFGVAFSGLAQHRVSTGKVAIPSQSIGTVDYTARKNFTDKCDLPANFLSNANKNIGGGNNGQNTQAMWDIQFQYDIATLSGLPSGAGVVWTGTEFWVSKWNGPDTLMVFDAGGAFQGVLTIAGIGPVRGMTTDGTNVYTANNTATINKISISSSTVTGSFNAPLAQVRFVSYDNSATPGLWIGNFNTDLTKIDIPASGTANVISNITAATHTLSGMYGAAYDGTSTGGPYLWVFTQTDPLGGLSRATIAQVVLPAGNFTGVTRNVNADLLVNDTTGLAGGITIAQLPGYPYRSLIGVDQGVKMVGYELNFVSVNVTDVRADSLDPANGLSLWPWSQNTGVNLSGKVKNIGNTTVSGISKVVRIYDGVGSVINTYTTPATNLVANASQIFNVGPWTAPAMDVYTAWNRITAPGDNNAANDSIPALMWVNDSTFARDYASFGEQVGGIGVGAGTVSQSAFGQIYPMTYPGKLTSITVYFSGPRTVGDHISMSVYNASPTAPGASLLASTANYTFTQNDVDSGVVLTMPLISGPLAVGPGHFFVCVNEGDSLCGIAMTPDIYGPSKIFAKSTLFNAGAWTDVGLLVAGGVPVKRAFVLRPNFACTSPNFAGNVTTTSTGCGISAGTATVAASNGSTPYTYTWNTVPAQYGASISNLPAGIYSVTIRDVGNCITTATGTVTNPNAPNATATTQNAQCNGGSASMTANATGGQAPYTYTWNTVPPQFSQTALVSVSGTYIVNVTDALGCTSSATTVVTMPSAISATVTQTNATCNGGNDGSATATGAGGTGSLTYSWSNGQTAATATGLAAGNYSVTVTDDNGCTKVVAVIITEPSAITIATSSTGSSGSNGTATATPSGGTSPYTYSWNNAQVTNPATGLAPGTYTVTVTDANGCTQTANVTVGVVGVEFASAGINVFEAFPNPNKGTFTVKLQLFNAEDVKLSLVDLSGKQVYNSQLEKVTTLTENISLNNLAAGVYMLTAETAKGKAFVKVIVE